MPDAVFRREEGAVDNEGIHSRSVLWVAASILLALLLVPAACWGLLRLWQVPLGTGPNRALDFQPAAPRLQAAPQDERAAYFAEKEKVLHGYAWVDRQAGTARIPIEVAMAAMIARGTPSGARKGQGRRP
ncbi:MAG: hypothetical protein ACM3X0_06940 [Bacteroidota bacterium]